MARARNIKPGFFSNDVLAECEPLARLLFAGLWTIADREGRLEDRPKRIKAELLPYDDCNIDALLDALHSKGFILRYSVENQQLIQILAFTKHQNPHKNEVHSTLPQPEQHSTSTVQTPEQHSTSTVQTPEQHSTNRADSLKLIPDSIDISAKADTQKADKQLDAAAATGTPSQQHAGQQHAGQQDGAVWQKVGQHDFCPHNDIIALYAKKLPMGTQVREWTAARQQMLKARWREKPERQSLDWWEHFFGYVAESDFLTGKVSSRGSSPFTVSLPWLCKSENFAKVLEGTYENKRAEVTA